MSEIAGSARATTGKVAAQNQPSIINEDEVLNWDYALELAPPRPAGTIEVVLTRVQELPPVVEIE
jgi:hypothetical protein